VALRQQESEMGQACRQSGAQAGHWSWHCRLGILGENWLLGEAGVLGRMGGESWLSPRVIGGVMGKTRLASV
jgi:hypothetical protein